MRLPTVLHCLLTSLFIILFFFTCSNSSKFEGPTGYPLPFGWFGPPEKKDKEPYDYFYLRESAEINNLPIKKKSEDELKESCLKKLSNSAKNDLISKMAIESLYPPSELDLEILVQLVEEYKTKVDKISMIDCQPLYYDTKYEYVKCDCIFYLHWPDGINAIKERYKELKSKQNRK